MTDPHRMVFVSIISSIILGIGLLFYRYIFPKKKIDKLVLLLLVSVLPLISIFRSGTYQSGDLSLHTSFLINFYENLKSYIFLPQWAPDLCGGRGCPIYIFEYISPYYIGSLFHLFGFSFLNSIKIVLALSFILSGLGMYLWLKTEFNERSAFVGSLFYLFAPYHLEDLHFRISVGEVFSFFPLPFVFYFTSVFIKTKQIRYYLLIVFFIIFLILSHSSTTIAILPILIVYASIKIFQSKDKNIKLFIKFILTIIFAIGISSFYWLPGLIEIKYNWTSLSATIGGFRHVTEFLYSPARYGFLFQGNQGELRLIIGYPHLLAVVLCLLALYKRQISLRYRYITICFILFFALYFLSMMDISEPIIAKLPLVGTFVLIWRLLLPISLITSFLAAIITMNYKNKIFIFFLCIFTIGSTILNWGNRKMVPEIADSYKNEWSMYTEYYVPGNTTYEKRYKDRISLVSTLVLTRDSNSIDILDGKSISESINRTPTKHEYALDVIEDSNIKENTFYFPGWKVIANGEEIPINYENKNGFGLITFQLKKGLYKVDVLFTDTPIRKVGKYVSLLSLIALVLSLPLLSHKLVRANTKRN
jgi:hypothetical protein